MIQVLLTFWAVTLWSMDTISCLQAKSNFLACAEYSKTEDIPLRTCLNADSGYAACRKREGSGSHDRCLPTKGQYEYCRQLNNGALTHFQCAQADSGFKDCVEMTRNPLECLGAKGGYGACRKANPNLPHIACLNADGGYADCMAAKGSHFTCTQARRSYKYCRTVDQYSHEFCVKIGKGYAECKQAGFPLAHCMQADHGFADCAKYKP